MQQNFNNTRMKQLIKRAFLLSLIGVIVIPTMAIPPLPGLNLTEPTREPAPRGIVSQQRALRMVSRSKLATSLPQRGLLIMAEFSDTPFAEGNTQQAFDSLANGEHYTYNGAMGSCKEYYIHQSNGLYTPHFDIVGPVVLPHTTAYYGSDSTYLGDDRYMVDFIVDACLGAQELGVDFSNYDGNNDGYVDLVYVIYAGYSQAEGAPTYTIWPHAWDLESALYYGNTNQTTYYVKKDNNGNITSRNLPILNGKTLLRYACSNELIYYNDARNGVGTICHEFGHVLGLADLYITDSNAGGNNALTPGTWALMSNGAYLNNGNTPPNLSVWEKYSLGWVDPAMLYANEHVVLPADGKTYRKLNRTGIPSPEGAFTTDTTYYFENRQMTGWDTYLPGHGMLVWRIVYDTNDWYYNGPNNHSTRFQLITANGHTPYTSNMAGGARQDIPFPGSQEYTEYAPYDHTLLSNIQEVDSVISFDFTNTHYTDSTTHLESPIVEMQMTDGVWYNLLGQPITAIESYRGVAISRGKKVIIR